MPPRGIYLRGPSSYTRLEKETMSYALGIKPSWATLGQSLSALGRRQDQTTANCEDWESI